MRMPIVFLILTTPGRVALRAEFASAPPPEEGLQPGRTYVDWQLIVVGLIVAASCVYLVRQSWRSWTGRRSGCTGCSCKNPASSAGQAEGQGAAGTFIPSDQLSLRRRPG